MKRDKRKARLAWLWAIAVGAALTPLAGRAAAITGDVMYGDAKISVVNAETNWVDGDLLLVWTNKANRTGSFTLPGLAEARFLVIGGGGAGGSIAPADSNKNGCGGGGGAGGFVELAKEKIGKGTYKVYVGAGGLNPASIDVATMGTSGGASAVSNGTTEVALAYGGGGGGARSNGGNGASGGGASLKFVSGKTYEQGIGGTGIQGNNGGSTAAKDPSGYGAGGGGAGAAAADANKTSNAGGDGLPSTITGSERYYAGGGGGGCCLQSGSTNHPGGQGGGGAGGVYTFTEFQPQPGVDGYGGGGGGGGYGVRNRGGDGGCGGVYVRISFALDGPVKPPASQEITYDGEEHVFVKETMVYTIKDGVGVGKDAGEYRAVLKLQPGFQWEDGGNPDTDREVTLKINPAQAQIKNLVQKGWVKDTPAAEIPKPSCTVNFSAADEPFYEYCRDGESKYTTDVPSTVGTYYLRATVKDDPKGNYRGTSAFVKFAIYEDPGLIFRDYVEITNVVYTGTSPKELTNFPYKVTLANDKPLGFLYDRAGTSGEDICFMDADGNMLPYEIDDWNVRGESVIYVRVPLITATPQTIRLYWYPKDGSAVPAYDPSAVWEDWPSRSAYDAAAAKVTAPKFDDVRQEGKIVNYWKVYPSMNWTEWDAGAPAGAVTNKGQLAHGSVTNTIVNSLTGEILGQLPVDVGGVYRLSFGSTEPEKYNTPEYHIDVRIVEHDPMDDLKGDAASLTLSGRVLLANDDDVAGREITDQGYWQLSSVRHGKTTDYYPIFWTHEGDHGAFANLKEGVNHVLWHTNYVDGVLKQTAIWTLQDVMIGSTATAETLSNKDYCYLPYSSTSKMISSYANRTKAATRVEAGQLVMRNAAGAAIYSQCYTNGIGTVYFDAVNTGRYQSKDYYHLAVEVATETKDGREPTDENAEGDLDGKLDWQPCPILPLVRNNNATYFTPLAETNDVSLEISTGGTDKNFYRLCARVEKRGVARFRIVRTKHSPGGLIDAGTCMITLDNIVVSYPRNTANVTSFGTYDPNLKERLVVGQAGAMMTPFPAITDAVIARTKADVYMGGLTNADPSTFIQLTRMHYRWRYLNQVFEPWQTIDLRPRDGYVAEKPLDLPELVGDVEYWFETFTQMPFYEFFDYSGKGYGLLGQGGVKLYSEEMAIVTNRLDLMTVEGTLPGNNENWFFRLRGGKSDREQFRVYVKRGEDAEPERINMELSSDHTWRGYLRTPDAVPDGVLVRFEGINLQTPGREAYSTNTVYYRLHDDITKLPTPTTIEQVPTSNEWSRVVCDGVTGFLLFQLEEESRGLSIVHADYQDFNAWSDARDVNGKFVATSTDATGKPGTNPETLTVEDKFNLWHISNATNPTYWVESFLVEAKEMDPGKAWPVFEPFSGSRNTPNGFTVGPGQWVTSCYRDKNTGMAYQMQGQGKGYFQFVNPMESPRGLESVTFNARLAQSISFTDFSYWMGGLAKTDMSKYVFTTRAAYDTASRRNFTGNAALSVVAFYQPGVGCYELRVEQENATMSGSKVSGPGTTQRLSLYRWRYDAKKGNIVGTLLGSRAVSVSGMLVTDGEAGSYAAMFISVESTANTGGITYVRAGVTRGTGALGNTDSANSVWVWFNDTDDSLRLKRGTYGVLSSSCPGRFASPIVYEDVTAEGPSDKTTSMAFKYNDNSSFAFPSSGKRTCYDEMIKNGEWAVMPWRMETFADNGTRYGVQAKAYDQPIEIYTAPVGTTDWTLVATTNVSNFGSTSAVAEPITVNFWSMEDCSVKIATGGNDETARNDVVIDDFELRQWRGESYDEKEGATYFENVGYGSPTNFVFTQGWNLLSVYGTTNCQLNARRSRPNVATSIRSPLMDGYDGPGIGLGMFSFTYANAQPNVNLLLQIATNNITSSTGLDNLSKSVDTRYWTTVTNYSFAGLSPEELKSGSRSYYFGLHGVKGVMRIVMDPAVVAAVANETDPAKFGSIDITSALCRDEPALDKFSWVGWNLRTTDDADKMNISDVAATASENGLAAGLNNAVDKDIRTADAAQYPEHLPYVQTPAFASEVVGEVSFKARKYAATDPTTRITLFGAKTGQTEEDKLWVKLASWEVNKATYRTYTHKTAAGDNYCAFRLAVTGIDDVRNPMPDPTPPVPPYRVLIDEVLVMEAVRAQVAFRNVAAFRNHLDTREAVMDVMDRAEQPLCKEAWGVQAEIFAAQLADEVDLSTAKVRLWWYEGVTPWGFDRWKDRPGARNAWLTACDGTNLVFRSSYLGAPDAVMPPHENPETVQYMLEVVYRTVKNEPATNWLTVADWQMPTWYSPLDYNADLGGPDKAFSAYTILDTVSPGWAWINELNIFGDFDQSFNNSDRRFQFLEIAAPNDADLSEWSVRFVEPNLTTGAVLTNEVARFGKDFDLPGLKKDLKGIDEVSKCVFHVIASPLAKSSFDAADGRIDGTWRIGKSSSAVDKNGEIATSFPIAIQLVRPSGVIEHEIVAIGTNDWASIPAYDPERHVEALNAAERGGRFFSVGMDTQGACADEAARLLGWTKSLGVHFGNGGTEKTLAEDASKYWNNTMDMTPGRINQDQYISPDYPRPQGSSIIITARVEGSHIRQSFGDFSDTTDMIVVVYHKGSPSGTNITYTVDRWYELRDGESVLTNGAPAAVQAVPAEEGRPPLTFTVEVGRNASNDIAVVATPAINRDLEEKYGLGPDNRYREAVMDWLVNGVDAYGRSWHDADSGKIGLADFAALNDNIITNMTLTQMYWLDMDPTWNDHDLRFRAGMVKAPNPVVIPGYPDYMGANDSTLTNLRMSVKMVITNTAPEVAAEPAWAPYVLRSAEPGVTSWDYADPSCKWNWDSVTFKVTGILANGYTREMNPQNWVPLRWFVFTEDSFDANFTSAIEVDDPYTVYSPGYNAGWYDWVREHGWCPVFFSWNIDDRLKPVAVEILEQENYLTE